MTENELLTKQNFNKILILKLLYTKLMRFIEDDRKCRRAGYKLYNARYWNNLYVQAKTYVISHIGLVNATDNYDGIRVDFIKQFQREGLYNIEVDFNGVTYMNFLKRFYKDKKYSPEDMPNLQGRFFPILTAQFFVSQSQELPFHPLTVLNHIKTEISVVDIPGFVDVKIYGNNYHIHKFDMEGLENANKLINAIITGEIHQGL